MSSDDFIFLISDSGELTKAPAVPYKSEDDLQTLVGQYPEVLLAGEASADDALRWLLVSREAGIPDAEDSPDRWAVDHVFLDQNAVPTFVEVKRSSDTRIRREVVGQMLEYAANGRRHWPPGRLRALTEEQAKEDGQGSVQELIGLDEPDSDRVEDFWRTVDENIRDGRVRLLFVADRLPSELRAIIEFLNEKMESVEVLGVELRQYTAKDLQALVPRVVGQTEAVRAAKRRKTSRPRLTEEAFLEKCPERTRDFFTWALRESEERGMSVGWATQSFSLRVPVEGALVSVYYGWIPEAAGRNEAFVQVYVKVFGDDSERQAVRRRILELNGFRAGGEYTAELELTDDASIEHARKALEIVWETLNLRIPSDST